MFANLLKPKPDLAALILRIGLAAIMIVHGWIKLDVGLDQSSELIAGISRPVQTAVGAAELVCGIALLVGLGSRVAAIVLGAIQFGAIVLVTNTSGPEVIRSVSKRAAYLTIGPEYNMVLGFMCLAVIVLGSGCYSLDRAIACRLCKKAPDSAATPVPAAE